MNAVSQVSKEDFSNITVENSAIQFLLLLDGKEKGIPMSELPSYGVNLTIEKLFVTGDGNPSWEEEMVQCED